MSASLLFVRRFEFVPHRGKNGIFVLDLAQPVLRHLIHCVALKVMSCVWIPSVTIRAVATLWKRLRSLVLVCVDIMSASIDPGTLGVKYTELREMVLTRAPWPDVVFDQAIRKSIARGVIVVEGGSFDIRKQ